MSKLQMKINTKIGALYLVASSSALYGVYWEKRNIEMADATASPEKVYLQKAADQIHEFLAGERKTFDLQLEAEGTEFQKKVWRELAKIPYGKTCAYKDIAMALNDPNASRAVGSANGQNPHSIIVPCHRVIASDGTLGGYAGTLPIKTILLDIEKNAS